MRDYEARHCSAALNYQGVNIFDSNMCSKAGEFFEIKKENAELQAEIEKLKKENAELKAKLDYLYYSNDIEGDDN